MAHLLAALNGRLLLKTGAKDCFVSYLYALWTTSIRYEPGGWMLGMWIFASCTLCALYSVRYAVEREQNAVAMLVAHSLTGRRDLSR